MLNLTGGVSPALASPQYSAQSLTDTQKTTLGETLSKYDPENLTDDDAKALVKELKESGISAGKQLTSALDDAGFDAKGLAQQAGIGGGPGRPGGGPGGPGGPGGAGGPGGGRGEPEAAGGSKGPDSSSVELMQSIVDQLTEATEDEDSQDLLLSALEDAGFDLSQPTVDYRA